MAILNTTPTPNELYNGEMKKMNDTELRIVLIVTRATLGWEEDKKTKMRKKEDWISYYQLKQKSGRGYTAISQAISNCIKKGWIEARNNEGNLLDTKNKRVGKKIFYRLGRIFLDSIKSQKRSSESEEVKSTSSESEISESEISECEAYKRNSYTKETLIQKNGKAKALQTSKQTSNGKKINFLIEKFKTINPSYERLFVNKTQREAMERLLKKMGQAKLEQILNILPQIFGKLYAPRITTPLKLEEKLADLISYLKERSQEKISFIDFNKL